MSAIGLSPKRLGFCSICGRDAAVNICVIVIVRCRRLDSIFDRGDRPNGWNNIGSRSVFAMDTLSQAKLRIGFIRKSVNGYDTFFQLGIQVAGSLQHKDEPDK